MLLASRSVCSDYLGITWHLSGLVATQSANSGSGHVHFVKSGDYRLISRQFYSNLFAAKSLMVIILVTGDRLVSESGSSICFYRFSGIFGVLDATQF